MKIWIGRTESDLLTYPSKHFDYSITYYGSNSFPNFSYCSSYRSNANYNLDYSKFVLSVLAKLSPSKDFLLFFYSNSTADKLLSVAPDLKQHIAAYNPQHLTQWCNNKFYTRFWLSNVVNVPAFALLSKAECSYQLLQKRFPGHYDFVIQKAHSAGGSGTYKMTHANSQRILARLSQYEPYLVSPYYHDSISACCHIIIGKGSSLFFPIGLQRISTESDNLSYLGTIFGQEVPTCIANNSVVKEFIHTIAFCLAQNGYRGICGFDFLFADGMPYLVEINPRYMGSSFMVNKALYDSELPSLFELNELAFSTDGQLERWAKDIEALNVPYQGTSVTFSKLRMIPTIPKDAVAFLDGWCGQAAEEGAYLFRFMQKNAAASG